MARELKDNPPQSGRLARDSGPVRNAGNRLHALPTTPFHVERRPHTPTEPPDGHRWWQATKISRNALKVHGTGAPNPWHQSPKFVLAVPGIRPKSVLAVHGTEVVGTEVQIAALGLIDTTIHS